VTGASAALRAGKLPRAGALEALRAEWVKLRTVRSTTWSLLTLAGVSVLFTVIASSESETEGGSSGMPVDNDLVLNSLTGIWFGQVAAAVLAVLAITSEYSTRMIRTTLAGNPRRRTLLTAKTVAVGAVVLVVGLATSVTCFYVGLWILRGNGFTYENGYSAPSLADGATFRAVAGTGIYLALLAVLSLGVGAIVRHTAGAITAVLALLLAPVIAIGFLPENLSEWVEKVSLMPAGLAIQQTVQMEDMIPLGPWTGLGVVSAYAAAALVIALWLIAKRDA
jgi:ABC-type transport system involved in multi-copper enzyme maturation permease subunit